MITALPRPVTEVWDSLLGLEVGQRYSIGANEYILLAGVASLADGDFLTFDEVGQAARLAANAKGPVGVAQSAFVANKYGWALIYGKDTGANVTTGSADNGDLYATASAGRVDDTVVAGDRIHGAWGRSLAADNVGTVEVRYPYMDDIAD